MPKHNIQRLDFGTFRCDWEGVPNSSLKLNFDVLIREFDLKGAFCLTHWQARPKFLRRFGAYCSTSDQYYSCEYCDLIFENVPSVRSLQISERKFSTVPTAVLLLPNTRVVVENSQIIVRGES